MEFKINSKIFEKILSNVIPVIPSKTTNPLLQNFLFDIKDGQLTILATDLEIFLKTQVNIVSEKNYKFYVPAKLLFETVRAIPDMIISLSLEPNNQLKLTTDRGVYNLSYFETSETIELPEIPFDKEINLSSDELKRAIEKTSFAVGDEDMRPAMNGILLDFTDDGLRFVSTDGHRLVKFVNKTFQSDLREQYIIPKKAISILSKFLSDGDITVNLTKTYAQFKLPNLEFITRLIGEKYPNYNSVIPFENDNILKIKKQDIQSSIKRMLVFASDDIKQVKLNIKENEFNISIHNIDTSSSGQETIDCQYNGEPMEIGFNVFYLNDIVSHLDSEEIIFKLNSPSKACLIEPGEVSEKEEILMLLMPVRLNY